MPYQEGQSVERNVSHLGRDAALVTVTTGVGFLAKFIVNTASGAFIGHIDAPCAADPACTKVVVDVAQALPFVLPVLYGIGRTVTGIVVNACAAHPDGGTNASIRGQVR